MAPDYRFSATEHVIVSCWLHYWKDCTVCAISRKEQLSLPEIQSLCYCFLCQQKKKKKSRKKTRGPGLYSIDVETEVEKGKEPNEQCQKGKLQEIKEATYHVSPRGGDIFRNLGVLLYSQSTAPTVRILCA